MSEKSKLSKTKTLAIKLIYAALSILRDNDKEMPMRELVEKVEKTVDLSDWDRKRYEKTGYIRWKSILHLYSIECVKAGYLIKKEGIWYLTPEGEEALKLSPEELLQEATKAYRRWRAENPPESIVVGPEESEVEEQGMAFEEIEQIAMEGLEKYINMKNPYEFQDLVAALLRGMGYYTPFIAPRGKDGGVDIVVYKDPLGTDSPRIQVQIKHRQSSATVQEVRQLMGLLQKEGDVGIFVSSGGFTPDAKSTARSSHAHVELIDLSRFILLWQDFYEKLSEEDRGHLPLMPVYFLAKTD